jgi:hypothetical protein
MGSRSGTSRETRRCELLASSLNSQKHKECYTLQGHMPLTWFHSYTCACLGFALSVNDIQLLLFLQHTMVLRKT